MRHMRHVGKAASALVAVCALGAAWTGVATAQAQAEAKAPTDEVRPFYSWVEDATVTQGLRLEPTLTWGDFGSFNLFTLGARGAGEVIPNLEMGADLNFLSLDADNVDGQSGISDLGLYGRYIAYDQELRLAFGASLDLPIGSQDVGQETFDFELFGAGRYTLQNDMVLFANLGIESLELPDFPGADDRENGIMLGTGMLYPAQPDLAIIAELSIRPEQFALLGGGVDFTLQGGSHVRAGLGLGLDDGAPDFQFTIAFATILMP